MFAAAVVLKGNARVPGFRRLRGDAEVDLKARAGEVVVPPLHCLRADAAFAFARMARASDDFLYDPPAATAFDESEQQG